MYLIYGLAALLFIGYSVIRHPKRTLKNETALGKFLCITFEAFLISLVPFFIVLGTNDTSRFKYADELLVATGTISCVLLGIVILILIVLFFESELEKK